MYDKWRSTPVPPLMLHGTLPSTDAVGGRYDHSWSSVTNDDNDDVLRIIRIYLRWHDVISNIPDSITVNAAVNSDVQLCAIRQSDAL